MDRCGRIVSLGDSITSSSHYANDGIDDNGIDTATLSGPVVVASGNSGGADLLYNSSWSLGGSSGGGVACGDREKVLFIGFEESWERDLWSAWLIEVIATRFVSRNVSVCRCYRLFVYKL